MCTCSATWRSPWNHKWQMQVWMLIVILVKVKENHRVGRNVEKHSSKKPKGQKEGQTASSWPWIMKYVVYQNSGCNGWTHPVRYYRSFWHWRGENIASAYILQHHFVPPCCLRSDMLLIFSCSWVSQESWSDCSQVCLLVAFSCALLRCIIYIYIYIYICTWLICGWLTWNDPRVLWGLSWIEDISHLVV